MEEEVWLRHEDDTDKAEDCGSRIKVTPLLAEHADCQETGQHRGNEGEGRRVANGNLPMMVALERDLGEGKEVAGNLNAAKQTSENNPKELLSVLVGSNGVGLHGPATKKVDHKIHNRASEGDRGRFDFVCLSEMTDSRGHKTN